MAEEAPNGFLTLGSWLESGSLSDVKLVVGKRPEPAVHPAHKVVLAQNSEYFKRLFYGSNAFKESAENEVILSDHNPGIFEIVLHWLYNGKFYPDRKDDRCHIITAAKVFVEAAYFGIPSLQERTIQVLIWKLKGGTKQITYSLGADLEESFNQTIIRVFQLYPGEAKYIDKFLSAIHANNMVGRVMQVPGMRNMLLEEPSLAVRLLEVCFLEEVKTEDTEEGK